MSTQAHVTLEYSLNFLNALEPDDLYGERDLQDIWSSLIQNDRNVLAQLYDLYFETASNLLGHSLGSGALGGLDEYKFILAFSSARYLGDTYTYADAWRLLQGRHQAHISLIETAMGLPDKHITERHMRTNTGTWGDIVGAMLGLYAWHSHYSSDPEPTKAEVAQFIPGFYRAFPRQQSFLLAGMLMHHPDAIEEAAALIRFYLMERGRADEGVVPILAFDMLGHHADKRDLAHANCPKILAKVLNNAADWPEEAIKALMEHLILTPLGIEPYTFETAIARQKGMIENQRRILGEARYGNEPGMSAQSQKEEDEQTLRNYEAELEFISGNFDEWNARRRQRAIQRIAVSAITRKALKAVAGKLPSPHRDIIDSLLDEAASYGSRPKRFTMPKSTDNRFKDFGLKLLVIEELMYRQKLLEPLFDIYEFAQEYEKREISVETDGYTIIPEAERYFRRLPISDAMLSRVETLHQSSGLDGGPHFMTHLFPFWDPGAGDQPMPVSEKAIEDLHLLPNLKRISGLENSRPSPKLLSALATRGIELVNEDDARHRG